MADKTYKLLGINVSAEEREQVHKLAKLRKFEITSDYIRSLIEADAEKAGFDLKFTVDRGGWRGGSKDEGEE